jgi:hypothetical protein
MSRLNGTTLVTFLSTLYRARVTRLTVESGIRSAGCLVLIIIIMSKISKFNTIIIKKYCV